MKYNSNNNNNNNNNNNINQDLNYLFYKCFHNKFIRYQIIKHLKLFKIHKNIRSKLEDFKNYKYRYYLTSLVFEKDQDVDASFLELEESLPPNIESVHFSFYFNKIIKLGISNSSFSKLTSVSFSSDFNKPILKDTLPSTIKYLRLGRLFNQKLLSGDQGLASYKNLETIIFGAKFNNQGQPLELSLYPDSLTKLKFGAEFNQELIPEVFPLNLKSLKFGQFFRKSINHVNSLPKSLTKLKVSSQNGCYLDSKILSSLENLNYLSLIYMSLDYIDLKSLPPSLTCLAFGCSTTNVSYKSYENQLIPSNIKIIKGPLFEYAIPPPLQLEKLDVSAYFNKTLNIEILVEIYNDYLKKCSNKISNNSNHNQLEEEYKNQQTFKYTIDNVFKNLKYLKYGSFNKEVFQHQLPRYLTTLLLGHHFNSVIHSLPETLTYLSVGDSYDLEFGDNVLQSASNLETLIMGNKFRFKVPSHLKKLKTLVIPDNYKYSFESESYPVLESLEFVRTTFGGIGKDLIQNETQSFLDRFIKPVASTLKVLILSLNQAFSVPLNHITAQNLSLPNIQTLSIGANPTTILDYKEPIQFKEFIVDNTNRIFLNNLNNIEQFINILKVNP